MMEIIQVTKFTCIVFLFCLFSCNKQCFGQSSDVKKKVLEREANEIKEDVELPYKNEITTATTVPSTSTEQKVTRPPPASTSQSSKSRKPDYIEHVDEADKYLIDGILDIIDERFETLNKRIMTLERNMNTLQYYNFRSFRVVNTHLHSIDSVLHNTNNQMDQLGQQNKAIEVKIIGLNKEVIDLQSENSGMFQAIEQNLVHFHQDIQSRFAELKDGIDQSNKRLSEVRNDTVNIDRDLEEIQLRQAELQQTSESAVILSSNAAQSSSNVEKLGKSILKISESVALNSDVLQSSIDAVMKNMSAVTDNTADIKYAISSFLSNVTVTVPLADTKRQENKDDSTGSFKEFKASNSVTRMSCSKMFEMLDEKLKQLSLNVTCKPSQTPHAESTNKFPADFQNQSQTLLQALSTVNDNVFQSVTLYRHTGNLIERVIADTELIGNEQVRLRDDIIELLTNGTLDLFNQSLPEFTEFIELNRDKTNTDSNIKHTSDCQITKSVTDEIVRMTQNGTQLLELLTELATTSTSSLKQALSQMDKTVDRMDKNLDDTKNSLPRDDPKAGGNQFIRDIHNRTEWIYQLVEAIASNTGWIPYIFHKTRFVESQVNKTLKLTNDIDLRTQEIMIRQRANMAIMFKPPGTNQSPIVEATSRKTEEGRGGNVDKLTKPGHQEFSNMEIPEVSRSCQSANESRFYNDMMEFIYVTNTKINRLIPALTVFLGEPEPFITLSNGSNEREGRVEIYHKGVWGTIAGSLSHIEASYICRKLGYLGGVSAGSGRFGPGTGAFWNLNVTCLRTRWCDAVTYVPFVDMYDHKNDVGVICDHMLRISTDKDDDDQSRHSGKLEVYHENTWFPVCYEDWGREETNVACKQLGFVEGAAFAVRNETITDTKWLMNVTCSGKETRLDACAHSGFRFNDCQDFTYVSIVCS